MTDGVKQPTVMVLPGGRVSRKDAALALGRSPKTLAEWHRRGIGPRGFRVRGRVFYHWDQVLTFAEGVAAD